MATIKVMKIADTSPGDRRAYVANVLNLDVTGSETDSQITAMIAAAQPGSDTIFVAVDDATAIDAADAQTDAAAQPVADDSAGRLAGSLGRGDPRVTILIPATDDVIGRADVVVGVNGVIWQLKRSVDLDVPWRVVEALGLTVQDIVRHDIEKDEVIITKTPRYTVTYPRGMPPRDLIEAWFERTKNEKLP